MFHKRFQNSYIAAITLLVCSSALAAPTKGAPVDNLQLGHVYQAADKLAEPKGFDVASGVCGSLRDDQ